MIGAEEAPFRQGRVDYVERWSDEGRLVQMKVALVYNPSVARQKIEYRGASRSPLESRSTYVVGRGEGYQVTERPDGSRDVRFSREKDRPIPNDHRFGIVPAPSYPLGVGYAGDAAKESGWRFGDADMTAREGSHIHFEYGPDGLRRTTRLFRPGVGTEHAYEGAVDAGGGVRVPRRYTETVLGGGPGGVKSFEIERADFATPVRDEDAQAEWYAPNVAISDARVDPPVGWTYEELVRATGKKSGLTPAELLKLSEERAPVFRRDMDRKRQALAQQNSRGLTSLAVVICVFVVVLGASIGLVLVKNRRQRPRG